MVSRAVSIGFGPFASNQRQPPNTVNTHQPHHHTAMGHQQPPPPPKPTVTIAAAATAPPVLRPILSLDAAVSHYFHTLTKPLIPRPLLRFFELLADFRFFFPVALSLLLAAPSSSPLRHHLLLPLVLCSLLDLLFVALLKLLVRRSRPSYSLHGDYNAVVSVDHFSFPSGHSSRVFFVASIFSLSRLRIVDALADPNHPRVATIFNRWIGGDEAFAVHVLVAAVWVWAVATAISRIALGRHYMLDVLFGACCGVLEAVVTLRALRFQAWI